MDDRAGMAQLDRLSLDELIATQPNVEVMLTDIRRRIGDQLRELRSGLGIGLEEMTALSKGGIDSAGLSRLERGRLWSDDMAQRALAILRREQAKRSKPKVEKGRG